MAQKKKAVTRAIAERARAAAPPGRGRYHILFKNLHII